MNGGRIFRNYKKVGIGRMKPSKEPALLSSPVRVVTAYLVIGGLWISFVRRGLEYFFSDQAAHAILDLF